MLHYVGSVHVRSLTRAHKRTCPPDVFCIARTRLQYAKVSGADSIACRTQLHLTPAEQVMRSAPLIFIKKLLKSDSGNLNEMTMTFSFLPFLQIVPT